MTLPIKTHKVPVNIADYGGVQTYGSAGLRFNSSWVHHFLNDFFTIGFPDIKLQGTEPKYTVDAVRQAVAIVLVY